MKTITLVTGNAGKLKEWQRLFPAEFKLLAAAVDLPEIQSLDLEEIIVDKAKRAYEQIGSAVMVEDISAGLDELGGLPGPFIKYFEQRLGPAALYKVASGSGSAALVTAMVAYYDGNTTLVARADVAGTVVPPRGDGGFGFDVVFVPAGQTKTFAEMSPSMKDRLSHRSQAIKALVRQLA